MTTITLPRAVVEQALSLISDLLTDYPLCKADAEAIAALSEALDAPQPEPVPVGWLDGPNGTYRPNHLWRLDPLPPQSVAWSIPLFHHMPPRREPLLGELGRQQERWDSFETRSAFVDGWISAEMAYGIGGKP